ncbi:hypothetical protein [Amycolatopsis sp. DSM 110486]|uniref:hypothetical protein n=1 Tax=Amycolatopsis sp. DSM 110486 TaxID=2865832 RepID=UPI001C699337|nr:hypothetical protein [Amycolatopsis sp. DSM 110486]QYN23147.1 hypothetical protein K1T34_12215 [Amycolatopsis sp. DSM 110486]
MKLPKVKPGDQVAIGTLNPDGTRGPLSCTVTIGPSRRIPAAHGIGETTYVISVNGKAVR